MWLVLAPGGERFWVYDWNQLLHLIELGGSVIDAR